MTTETEQREAWRANGWEFVVHFREGGFVFGCKRRVGCEDPDKWRLIKATDADFAKAIESNKAVKV